jgi:hypothetical protein
MTSLGRSFARIGAFVGAGSVLLLSRHILQAGSAAEETRNKFNVVFGTIRTQASQTAATLASSFALSREESERLLSNTGDLLTGFGATQEQALELSTAVQELAGDLASFNNLPTEQASRALTSALLGEREAVKALGITISEAAVNQELMRTGQSRLTGEARLLARAQATLAIATRQSGNAIGDFARSSNSYANVQRRLNADLQDAAAAVGQRLLPAFSRLAAAFSDTTRNGTSVASVLGEIAGAAVTAVARVIELINALARLDLMTATERAQEVFQGESAQGRLRRLAVMRGRRLKTRLAQKEGRTVPVAPTGPTAPGAGGAGGGPGGARRALRDLASDEERFRQEQIQAEQDHITRFKEIQVAKVEAERQANAERIRMARESFDLITGIAANAISGLGEVFKMAESNQLQSIENTFKRRRALIVANVSDETKRAELVTQLEQQKEARIAAVQREAAERSKKLAIFETVISTAQGALQAFVAAQSLPYPANLILGGVGAGIVTGLGAAKIAAINAAPPPAQFGGTFSVPPGNTADSGLVAVNQGEDVTVDPVRFSGGGNGFNQTTVLSIGGVEFDAFIDDKVNKSLNSGNVFVNKKGVFKTA